MHQRSVLEQDFINSRDLAGVSRQGEGRRDQRADRMLDQSGRPSNRAAAGVIHLVGRTPTGRRFRVRFIPKEIENEPIARQA